MATKNDVDVLNEINGTSFGLSSMEIGKKYLVECIDRIQTQYGLRVVVQCDTVKFTLPESWNDRMSPNNIKTVMQSDKPLYVVYHGKISLPQGKFKHDIKFTRD